MVRIIVVILLVSYCKVALAQDSTWTIYPALIGGIFPNYPYDLKEYNPLLIPFIPFTKSNFYGEIRYNYDRNATLGLYGGRSLTTGRKALHIFTSQL